MIPGKDNSANDDIRIFLGGSTFALYNGES